MFAIYTGDDEHVSSLLVIADPDEREALVHDPRCYLPPYFTAAGWIGLDLLVAPVDWAEVPELVETSYRRVALRRMVKALDAGALRPSACADHDPGSMLVAAGTQPPADPGRGSR